MGIIQYIKDRVNLLVHRNQEIYLAIYNILGFTPRDISIYKEALHHKSLSIKEKGKKLNNERLEFLGDAILDSVVSDMLFNNFSAENEGFLTTTRSKLVKRDTLNKLSISIGLDKLVKSANRSHSHNFYIYGNALEAFIGAVYLDAGYDRCKDFIVKRLILPNINLDDMSKIETNFKSRVIEWAQKNKFDFSFVLINESIDKQSNPIFKSMLVVEGVNAGVGVGYSKKESQQKASEATLRIIAKDPSFAKTIKQKKDEKTEEPKEELPEASAHITTLDN